jgi:hypothetical protein
VAVQIRHQPSESALRALRLLLSASWALPCFTSAAGPEGSALTMTVVVVVVFSVVVVVVVVFAGSEGFYAPLTEDPKIWGYLPLGDTPSYKPDTSLLTNSTSPVADPSPSTHAHPSRRNQHRPRPQSILRAHRSNGCLHTCIRP